MICCSAFTPPLPGDVARRLDTAFAYLQSTDFSGLKDGIYPISGEDIYAIVESFQVTSPIDAEFECHRRYIDVQFVISGQLQLMIAERASLAEATAYNVEKDTIFYHRTDQYSALRLQAGQAAVLFPEDAHRMVCYPEKEPVSIRKCVVKVRV